MEILQFIFSGFWVFIGTLLLIGYGCSGIAEIIRSLWGRP
jgi:hypothetical protein